MSTPEWRKANSERVRAYKREWYAKNRSQIVNEVAERRKQLSLWFNSYKKNLRCARCGENHPACLDFHHRDADQKEISVSQMANWGWSVAKMMTEIEKCDVLCANCHRKLHWEERITPPEQDLSD